MSGPLRRYVGANGAYDFPVGYPNLTSYYVGWDPLQPQALHRRLRLEIQSQAGLNWIQVEFVPTVSDVCSGQLSITEADGTPHLQLHPEGYWRVQPNTSAYTITYDVKAYTWGFTAPPLADNRYAVVKRVEGSTSCSDWTRESGAWPPAGALGRVIKVDGGGRDTSYAHRLGWNSFSEMAIGITDVPLSRIGHLRLGVVRRKGGTYLLRVEGSAPGESMVLRVASGGVASVEQNPEDQFRVRLYSDAEVYVEGASGRKSNVLTLPLPKWWVEGEHLFLREGIVWGWTIDGRLLGRWAQPGSWELPEGVVYLIDAEGHIERKVGGE